MGRSRVLWRHTGEPPSDGEWEEDAQGRDVDVEIGGVRQSVERVEKTEESSR